MASTDHDPRLPLILALCTSNDCASVALGQPGCEPSQASAPAQAGSSGRVLALACELLARRKLRLDQLDAIAFDQGPGAFTGLRVGCAVAQGLGWSLQRPLLPVGALTATALAAAGAVARFDNAMSPNETAPRTVIVANDARMNQVYLAVFELTAAGTIRQVLGPRVLSPEDAISVIAGVTQHCRSIAAGDGFIRYPALANWAHGRGLAPHGQCRSEAIAVLSLAIADYQAGVRVDAGQAAPLYVRDRVALDVDEQRLARQ